MRFLHLIRLIILVIAVAYGSESLQHGWIYWLERHLGNADASFGRGYTSSISIEQIGVYITAITAALIVFFAIPRFRWGLPTLSWCLLIMGGFLLSNLYICLWNPTEPSFVMEIICTGQQLAFALSPLIIGLVLRYRFIEKALRPANHLMTKQV